MRLTLKEQSECGMFCPGRQNGMGCYVPGDKNSMGCYVRGDKKSMGCFVRDGKPLWDVLAWDVLSRDVLSGSRLVVEESQCISRRSAGKYTVKPPQPGR